jgi:translocation and assembly module TamB
VAAQGIGKGRLFVGKLDAHAKLTDGSGRVTASIGGRRGSRFDLNVLADVGPGKVALIAGGTFAGQRIAMPRRAIFTAQSRADGTGNGWQLAPAQVDYAGGRVVAQGSFGNGATEMKIGIADMPLSLGDVVFSDLGLGGKVSGNLAWHRAREGLPSAEGSLAIKGLTRSGLSLTSRPIDLAVVGALREQTLEARAIASEDGQVRGRLQARIDQLGGDGGLETRLSHGRLVGQMRYGGPADALWRLMALDAFDLTGPIDIAADIDGSLYDPHIRGSLAGNNLRLQSAVTGTDIRQIVARGSFSGSRLTLTNLSGRPPMAAAWWAAGWSISPPWGRWRAGESRRVARPQAGGEQGAVHQPHRSGAGRDRPLAHHVRRAERDAGRAARHRWRALAAGAGRRRRGPAADHHQGDQPPR